MIPETELAFVNSYFIFDYNCLYLVLIFAKAWCCDVLDETQYIFSSE